MRRVVLLMLILLALTMGLAGCGGKTDDVTAIKNTIHGCVDAYNVKNYEKVLDYLTGWDTNNKAYYLSMLSTGREISGLVTVNSISDVVISDDTATANCTGSMGNEEPSSVTGNFTKINGAWKINIEE